MTRANGDQNVSKHSFQQWRLYVVTDEHLSRGRSHIEIARAAIAGGAVVIQHRDKTASSGKFYRDAQEIRKLTREAGVAFIVNDNLDIALAVDADGLHIGQNDLSAPKARELLGSDRILGVSAATVDEALQAERDGADYLGVGPIFEARETKPDAGEPLGLQLLRTVREKCRLPIVAIGGINEQNLASVIEAGADAAAVISTVVQADDIAAKVRELTGIINAARSGNRWRSR